MIDLAKVVDRHLARRPVGENVRRTEWAETDIEDLLEFYRERFDVAVYDGELEEELANSDAMESLRRRFKVLKLIQI
ncbi:hypothetical protein MESMUL_01270 [Mesosutterella multiformis]|uniref:Uncharacterized protein n=1 Tax=Mesosutterella multiformis TaxID=2259133 RepID=A0A388SAV3_9BURK|nr:hypothetical protein [Mesosutterella multiformis]GBO92773.1 hypothetical protein MESMUL_01270 [Mesosutterella multiformis]